MVSSHAYEFETSFINSWADAGVYDVKVPVAVHTQMAAIQVDLCDINYVLRSGRVVRSDMDESRGLWDVRGKTLDDDIVLVTIAVASAALEVELVEIVKVARNTKRKP